MNIKTIELKELDKLHTIFRAYRSHDGFGNWFRGQSNESWALLPKAGREEYCLPNNRDLGRFNAWCSQAIAYAGLPNSGIERLALAQHHGLATRLLDWSKNPLVACFFACFENPQANGVVYILEVPDKFVKDSLLVDDLKRLTGVYAYIPNAIAPRVLNQKGLFTVHCDAKHPIEVKPSNLNDGSQNLVRIVIPATLKAEVMRLLYDYGIDRSVLFPDLDGLSAHVNSETAAMRKNT